MSLSAKKILFVAEAVSLAHVARPALLAGSLLGDCEPVFASNGQYAIATQGLSLKPYALQSLSPETFMQRLAVGRPVYTLDELRAYVEADERMLRELRPDVVVSDFRLTLPIAAARQGVPLMSLSNAYWSPYARRAPDLAPDLQPARLLGHKLFDPLFRLSWPLASRHHLSVPNRLRVQLGLQPLGSLGDYYCGGDVVMYADTPSLVPCHPLPPSHHFLGPLTWSPSLPLPPWWDKVAAQQQRTRVYINLGSTGSTMLLPALVAACRAQGWVCIVATAGRMDLPAAEPDVFVSSYLPGSAAAAAADVVICNGGSPSSYQALEQGRPVLGICSNLDQVLAMRGVRDQGAGVLLRAGECSPGRLAQALEQVSAEACRLKAARLQQEFRAYPATQRFRELLLSTLAVGHSSRER
ncbi:MAG: glycosyltransferase [Roseateles asaccharophilus]|uniref:UDP:flavonoid glycosyltransferase YjiC (YdhE family) n=1 Tax=Roseateles asaccharophilus TaxID=582607 RepID=A0A4R6NA02_9BURK|nr:nucleotide disphospho-sugar-binding domain-containing protein [Roseateles asaccharophilus]MDN3543502.1 glycosyl transferase family 1 [Roseateles asaccharophilus]TDP12120.1 UDP:flavonoid glycosyltransferase YjiC (YdhE family) [Roseateles asaccharophilus]